MAVETAKEVANDKTLRNKAEKERRLREKNQNNTKKFIEERKMIALKQGKEKEKLQAVHTKQLEELTKDIQLVISFITSSLEHCALIQLVIDRTLKCTRTPKWNINWPILTNFSSEENHDAASSEMKQKIIIFQHSM